MKIRLLFILCVLFAVLLSACQKEEAAPTPSLTGLWNIDLTTITVYDSLNNITSIDTSTWTNSEGKEVIVFERFTADNKYYFLSDSTYDTLLSATYTLNGNNLLINLPDTVFPWNKRTIFNYSNFGFETFQMVSNGSGKYKMTMRYKLIP